MSQKSSVPQPTPSVSWALTADNHISGKYLGAYAREMAWREDTRRKHNGALHQLAAGAALGHPVSRMWKGYWQRAERT
jgi:hypothetical protein